MVVEIIEYWFDLTQIPREYAGKWVLLPRIPGGQEVVSAGETPREVCEGFEVSSDYLLHRVPAKERVYVYKEWS